MKTWISAGGFVVVLAGILIAYGHDKVTRSDVSTMIATEAPYVASKEKLDADHVRYDAGLVEAATERKELRTMFVETLTELKGVTTRLDESARDRRHRRPGP